MNPQHTPRFSFLAALIDAGYAVYVIRHGNALPNPVDFERQLSPKGIGQAYATRETLKAQGVTPSLVVCSNAPRVIDTVFDQDWPEPKASPALYIPESSSPIAVVINGAFGRLGYKPLANYRAEPGVTDALEQWREPACAFANAMAQEMNVKGDVAIGCHAIMSAEAAIAIALDADPDALIDVALHTNMEDGAVFQITRGESGVRIEYLGSEVLGHPSVAA